MYVDDILVTSSSYEIICKLMDDLNSEFSLKNVGDVTYFLEV